MPTMWSQELSGSWRMSASRIAQCNYILVSCALLYDLFYVSMAWFKHDDPATLFIYSALFALNLLNTLAMVVLLISIRQGCNRSKINFYLVVNSCTTVLQIFLLVYLFSTDDKSTPKPDNAALLILVLILELIYVGANGVTCYLVYVNLGSISGSLEAARGRSSYNELNEFFKQHEQTLNNLDKEVERSSQLVKRIRARAPKKARRGH